VLGALLYDQPTPRAFLVEWMYMITSPHNPRLKLIRALAGRPKERRENGAFLAEGARLLEDALSAGWPLRYALAAESLSPRAESLLEKLAAAGVEVERVQDSLLAGASETEHSQGLLAVLDFLPPVLPENPDFIVIFDQIRDPGNLGTLLRAAAAAGAEGVFLPPETADAFAPKVVRAGMGAHFRLPIFPIAWQEIHAKVGGMAVYLAETQNAVACWQADFRSPLALVIGGEAEGASQQARALAKQNIVIPMPGGMESLNAAMAGTILMFEVVRQRQS
jgi:TrmH family RNA methyltransferase